MQLNTTYRPYLSRTWNKPIQTTILQTSHFLDGYFHNNSSDYIPCFIHQ